MCLVEGPSSHREHCGFLPVEGHPHARQKRVGRPSDSCCLGTRNASPGHQTLPLCNVPHSCSSTARPNLQVVLFAPCTAWCHCSWTHSTTHTGNLRSSHKCPLANCNEHTNSTVEINHVIAKYFLMIKS